MFGSQNQPGPPKQAPPPSVKPVQVSPFPISPSPVLEAPPLTNATLPANADAQLPGPQTYVPADGVPSWEREDDRDPEEYLTLPVSAPPNEVVNPRDISNDQTGVSAVSGLDLPVGELPIPIEGEGFPRSEQIVAEPSDPTPRMRRYALPSDGTATHVVPAVPYRRDVWIVSRGAGGLQATYYRNFGQPDLIDIQVNGIPIPLFAGQDLFMRVIGAAAGDDLEISLIIEPRASGR